MADGLTIWFPGSSGITGKFGGERKAQRGEREAQRGEREEEREERGRLFLYIQNF